MEFQIHDAAGGQYYWKIVANNGRTLASSERYYNKSDARSACDSVKSWDASAPILDKTSTAARAW